MLFQTLRAQADLCRVADYGLAVLTHEEDKCNPYMYGDAGTEGYLAPEQLLFRDPVKKKWVDDMDMLSPCNGKSPCLTTPGHQH